MWKKYAVLTVALVCVLAIAGTVAVARDQSVCAPPVTQTLASDFAPAQVAVDKWVGVYLAASYGDPKTVGWGIHTIFKLSPGVVDALVAVGDKYDPNFGYFGGTVKLWRVKLVRDCQGGGWRVVSAVRAKS